ncbi:unnamed protein product (macronuclear) [Paramecium tetraurelia]|uniref:Protein kinase domain-containing protein n=1 Tax=Paramecium tetraurelia TaxID=5888 RepID=A0DYV0_PARTE|nr:uncharacterized protein GSPATT00003185001 [Paramecium tetraurelia]CAK88217.1 unnamed protein product [Paramecium tetraurelia]|eukprot:XP_001455614.1 hypothetical protein (macronuclear) [Paramecium tetraurelia strain d4-2]
MGNKVYIIKSADNSIFNQNQPLEDQFDSLGGQSFPHIDRVELYKLKRENTKYATIFEKRHSNTATDDEGPLLELHEQLMLLKHSHLVKYYGLCIDPNLTTNLQMSRWFYEAVYKTLKQVCGHHFSNKSYIPERQLWKSLHEILLALHFLDARQKWHTHIQPDSVYLDKNDSIKLIPKGVLRLMSGYQVVLTGKGQALLSPQQMEGLKQKLEIPIHDIQKSDVFSLGMTFLELMTLKDSFECYNYDLHNPYIKEQIFQERQLEVQHIGYSTDLVRIVLTMLQYEEIDRPTFLELLNSHEVTQNLEHSRNNHLQPTTHTPKQELKIFQNRFPSNSSNLELVQPSIPITNNQQQIQSSPIRIQSQVVPPQYLPINNPKQQEADRLRQEQILREQQIQQHLQLQLRQQQQLLQQQQQQQQQQQLLIEQQSQQILLYQQQLNNLKNLAPQPKLKEQQAPQLQDYMIQPLPTPPIILDPNARNSTVDEFQESQELKNRINSALALSRQAINKYK